jgi:hypothetical protein
VAELEAKIASLSNKVDEGTSLDKIYPVGSYYISGNNTNPANLFGGTWEKIEDRFLLASSSTYALGSTGGEATHTLTVAEMPSHSHSVTVTGGNHSHLTTVSTRWHPGGSGGADYEWTVNNSLNYLGHVATTESGILSMSGTAAAVGNGVAHNNMPPYLVVNVWKRTA